MRTVNDILKELDKIHDAQQNLHFLKDRLGDVEPVSSRMCEDAIVLLGHYRNILTELPIKK